MGLGYLYTAKRKDNRTSTGDIDDTTSSAITLSDMVIYDDGDANIIGDTEETNYSWDATGTTAYSSGDTDDIIENGEMWVLEVHQPMVIDVSELVEDPDDSKKYIVVKVEWDKGYHDVPSDEVIWEENWRVLGVESSTGEVTQTQTIEITADKDADFCFRKEFLLADGEVEDDDFVRFRVTVWDKNYITKQLYKESYGVQLDDPYGVDDSFDDGTDTIDDISTGGTDSFEVDEIRLYASGDAPTQYVAGDDGNHYTLADDYQGSDRLYYSENVSLTDYAPLLDNGISYDDAWIIQVEANIEALKNSLTANDDGEYVIKVQFLYQFGTLTNDGFSTDLGEGLAYAETPEFAYVDEAWAGAAQFINFPPETFTNGEYNRFIAAKDAIPREFFAATEDDSIPNDKLAVRYKYQITDAYNPSTTVKSKESFPVYLNDSH